MMSHPMTDGLRDGLCDVCGHPLYSHTALGCNGLGTVPLEGKHPCSCRQYIKRPRPLFVRANGKL